MAKSVYQLVGECHCCLHELIEFLNRNGILCSKSSDLVSDRGCELAGNYFLRGKRPNAVQTHEILQKKTVAEMIKEFGCSRNELFKFLRSKGLVSVILSTEVPTSHYKMAKEHFLGVPTPEPEQKPESAKKTPAKVQTQVQIDYRKILAGYDVQTLATSPIQYFEAVSDVADTFLDVLQNYETAQSKTISEFSQTAVKLGAHYVKSPHLDEKENSLLEERQKFLARRLALGTDEVKTQILLLKEQAKNFSERLDEINHNKNSVRELAALESEPRASFAFLVENAARLIQNAQLKMDFFILNKKFVAFVVNAWESWSNDYKIFKTNSHEELIAACRAADVDEKIFGKWYEDWRGKRFLIEQRFLPLIEFALKGHLLSQDDKISAVEETLKALRDYKDALDKFYLNERKSIYQKFAFTAGGDLLEKFETESELYKQTEKFQREWQKIIFSCDKTEDRNFLLKWAEPLLNLSVNAIVDFLEERQLDTMTEKILSQFAALRRQSLMSYLADSAAFAKALQQREKETTQLFFRMRKGLRK